MNDRMLKKEGLLNMGYSIYIWICLYFLYENLISAILMHDLNSSGLMVEQRPSIGDLYERIFIFTLMIALMILLAHCVEKFLRINLFFPITNILLSGTTIFLFFTDFCFTVSLLYIDKVAIATIAFMALRFLLFMDSIILLKKYFRAKKETKT